MKRATLQLGVSCWLLAVACWPWVARAQQFHLERHTDSLSVLCLGDDRWMLRYPVYQFQTGDVDGDGSVDALVGVVKTTRYDSVCARRLFIFKGKRGKVRPLWMGSRLGGRLEDFRFVDGRVRSLEYGREGHYAVAEYEWQGFGLGFVRYLLREATADEARRRFESDDIDTDTNY